MEDQDRCGLCLGVDAPIDAANPRLRAVVRDLFSFWPDDVAVFACLECFTRIEDFYSFYERVRDNQLILLTARKQLCSNQIKEEDIAVKQEWDHLEAVKQEAEYGGERALDFESFEGNLMSDDDDDEAGSEDVPVNTLKTEKFSKKAPRKKSRESKDDGNYPTELIRDGQFVVSKKVLNNMASEFYNVECGECKSRFDKLSQMLRHFMAVHGGRPFVECCNKKIYRTEYMYQHMAKHLQPSAFQCHICSKDFTRMHILKNHLGHHVPEEERIHRCDKCNRSFAYKSLLMRHLETHIPDEERKIFKCDQCPKSFNNYYSHFNHVRSVHSSAKFLCPECGKNFRLKSNLLIHLESHSDHRIQCSVCAAMCKNNNALRKHLKRHSDVRYNCQQCEYTTLEKGHLKRHMLTKHSEERPFSCSICEKKFKLKKVLATHMAQHTGERKYCCPHCPKTFASSGNFSKHRKRMHEDAYKSNLLGK